MLAARAEDVSARIVETVAARSASLASTCAARSWTLTCSRMVREKMIWRPAISTASRSVRIAACDRAPRRASASNGARVWRSRKRLVEDLLPCPGHAARRRAGEHSKARLTLLGAAVQSCICLW